MSDIDLDALAAQYGIADEPVPRPATAALDQPARRLKVTRTDLDTVKPWRAVVVERAGEGARLGQGGRETPVGAFPTQADAIRTGCTALTFLAAGIPWRVQS